MRKRNNSWPMMMAILCCYSAIEAPLVYLYDLFNSPLFIASNVLISIILMFLSTQSWREFNSLPSKKKKGTDLVWLSLLTFSSLPFGLISPKALIFLKLLRFSGLIKSYQQLNQTHEISRSKKVILIVLGSLTGVHIVATTWLLIQPMPDLSHSEAYIKGLYWAVTTLTTTGYGDITPTNDLGRIFTILVMLSGFSAFGIIVGNISNLIMAKNRHLEANREKMEDLASFMQYYEIPKNLRSEVFNYHLHRMQKRLSENDSKIISDLPNGLQGELQVFIKMKLIDGLPIFHGLSHSCLKIVAQHLEPLSFSAGSIIIKRGEKGEEMFIIDQGEVEVYNDHGQSIALLKNGQCVGEIALLTQALRTADVKAKTYCDVYRLSKEDFDLISSTYPELDENFQRLMIRRNLDKRVA
jgi:voltage-gated potassium channel